MILNILDIVGLLAVAILFGSMAFFSAVVAPLTFIKLDPENAGRFIRALFPWYYAVVAGLSLLAAAALAWPRPVDAAVASIIALGALVSRQILMPRINRHRDRMLAGETIAEQPFARLHRLSVWINTAQLIAAFAVLLHLAAV